ncbi:hypothetical protein VN97_g5291 [Penicillium thymicola]|uniref:Uncharacterized protein n=1 Tax=Penicillium thymicola TaxID=293382 RepID=A0AAI9X8P9_PENTH|nr:hypothetical protein VN97_g5291 [Penicillium thymicola]
MAADHPPQTLQRLNNPRDFQTLLREVQNDPKVENPLEFAKSRRDTLTLLYEPDAWEDHARQTRNTWAYSIPVDASSERAFPGLYSQRSKIYLRTEDEMEA